MSLSIARFEYEVLRRLPRPPRVEAGYAVVAVILTIGIAVAAFALHLNLASAASILLLETVVVSIEWGVVQGTVVSLTAVGCLDFFFTAPVFQFSVLSRENWVALATFEITALLVSRLSWKERLRARDQEYQRQAISKLYKLSNAILLVDARKPELERLGGLMREVFSIEVVELWEAPEIQDSGNPAHGVFAEGRDEDSVESGWSERVLRLGTSAIGGMRLQGWEVDPALADAAASLIAVAIERGRSAQKENRAEAARNTEQLRTAVLDALAHGFKTPLTAIQTASSGLLAIGELGSAQTELVEIIDEEVSMLATLTTRLLQTAALDAREIRVRTASISVVDVVERLLELQGAEVRRRIKFVRPALLVDVQADRELLSLALAQLIDNATKYSPAGTEIDLAIEQGAAVTTVTMSNPGEPIAAADLQRVFERYYRGAQIGRGSAGTGLGLSIVKKIAEAHGGDAAAACEGDRISVSFHIAGGRSGAAEALDRS